MTTLMERMDKLPPQRRRKVERRAKALIAEEMSLWDRRRSHGPTGILSLGPEDPGTRT